MLSVLPLLLFTVQPAQATTLDGLKQLLAERQSLESNPETRAEISQTADKHRQIVFKLIDEDKLQTAEEFRVAASLTHDPRNFFENVQTMYELRLVAALLGDQEAQRQLPVAWDSLHVAMGFGQRLGTIKRPVLGKPGEFELTNVAHEVCPTSVRDALLDPAETAAKAKDANDNEELAKMMKDDQADRTPSSKANFTDAFKRDLERKAKTLEVLQNGGAKTGADYSNAGLLMQHGQHVWDFALAHECGIVAANLGHSWGRSLCSVSYDRMLMHTGRYQRFGTQLGMFKSRTDSSHISKRMRAVLMAPSQ